MMKARTSPWILILLLLTGAIIGSILWTLLAPVLPQALTQSINIGSTAAPWTLDLDVVSLTFGIVLKLNIGSLICMIIAAVIYWRL